MNHKVDWPQVAFQITLENMNRSYSPYSNFQVGSYLLTEEGVGFFGCNIENASYGATICAERVAMYKSISEGYTNFKSILIVADTIEPTPPCALCLQVMAEFCPPDFPIILANLESIVCEHRFKDLLTHPFGPSYLKKKGPHGE